jgi:hypothetical protein
MLAARKARNWLKKEEGQAEVGLPLVIGLAKNPDNR